MNTSTVQRKKAWDHAMKEVDELIAKHGRARCGLSEEQLAILKKLRAAYVPWTAILKFAKSHGWSAKGDSQLRRIYRESKDE